MRHPQTERGRLPSEAGAVFGRWKRPKKSSETGQNPAKKPAYRNVTEERTPTLPCCRDIKTAKSGPTGTTLSYPRPQRFREASKNCIVRTNGLHANPVDPP
ncbi:hypothetical protein V1285_003832 [Bradyrhizobium sp. AZCC 1620]